MDPAEAIFKRGARLWRRFRRTADEPGPNAARLEQHKDRLQLLAGMVFGEPLDILAAEDVGGVADGALLLPSCIDLFDSSERNLEAYLYRVAWSSVSRNLGFATSSEIGDSLFEALCGVLAAASTQEELHREFGATKALSLQLHPAVLAERDPAQLEQPGGVLEALVRRLLGEQTQHPTATATWLDDAASVRVKGAGDLRAQAKRLFAPMLALSGRGDAPAGVCLWGWLLPSSAAHREADDDFEYRDDDAGGDRNIIQLDKTIRLKRQKLGKREDRPLFHIFEKIETSEEYTGQTATPDASGSPDQMEDAIRDLSLGLVVRTPEAPRNLVRADVVVDPTGLEIRGTSPASTTTFSYPEWNYKKSEYRNDWCTLVEERYLAGDAAQDNLDHAKEVLSTQRRQVDELRANLLRALYKRRQRNRQSEGPEIDIEAVVERHADLAAGCTPPDRLYLAGRKTLRDVAILVLLDSSWSTDAWLNGRRVLDIELSSLLVVAEAFAGYLDNEVAVASFKSHTRNDVRFGILKGFEDSWEQLRQVAPSLHPDGYTRIGCAVRHATAILNEAKARKKLLVILSDGKPTDYDRYEGRYGQEDVKQAIREARQLDVNTFGIAIEKEAKLHLATMLGAGAYRFLSQPSMLPDVMADVFASMMVD